MTDCPKVCGRASAWHRVGVQPTIRPLVQKGVQNAQARHSLSPPWRSYLPSPASPTNIVTHFVKWGKSIPNQGQLLFFTSPG